MRASLPNFQHENNLTTWIVFICISLIIGCKGENKEPKEPVADYFNGMMRTLDRAKATQRQANLNTLKATITQYRVENGKNPQSLEELKSQLGDNFRFEDFLYNPDTGEVTVQGDFKP